MDAKTLSFGKNGEEPRVAFENIDGTELYPCVMFYSTNPGEKVKITDMKVHGTQRDLLPGEPNLAPMYAVLTESYVTLLRKLHNSPTWTDDVNEALLTRLNKIEALFPNIETHNIEDEDLNILDDKIKIEIKIDELCTQVWPALAVIGGLDRGLRMGGICKHKTTGKKAIVLGILKKGITTVNVQWESDGGVSDVAISNLEFVKPTPFTISKFTGLTPSLLLQITRLSGITYEISFPNYQLTDEEELLLNPKNCKLPSDTARCNSDPQIHNQNSNEDRPRTMEALTNDMISSIMGEVKRISTEKITASQSDSKLKEEMLYKDTDKNLETKMLEEKLLNLEGEHLKLAFLQFAALKVLGIFITSSSFTELTIMNDTKQKQEDMDSIKEIMQAIVNKSIEQCKLSTIVTVADLERAQTVLHLSYTKCRSQEEKNVIENEMSVNNSCSSRFSNVNLLNEAGGNSSYRLDVLPKPNNLKPSSSVPRPSSSLNADGPTSLQFGLLSSNLGKF